MGRQINFFLHPDDQPSFDTLLKSFGDIILIPYFHNHNKLSTIEDTIVRDIKKEGERVYLVRKADLKDIKLTYFEKSNLWQVVDFGLPILHFDRSIYKDNKIHRGRLYFQPQFVENSQWIAKSDDFIRWADNIIRTARRKLKKYYYKAGKHEYTEYLGENALKWLRENKAEVSTSGFELIPTKTT